MDDAIRGASVAALPGAALAQQTTAPPAAGTEYPGPELPRKGAFQVPLAALWLRLTGWRAQKGVPRQRSKSLRARGTMRRKAPRPAPANGAREKRDRR